MKKSFLKIMAGLCASVCAFGLVACAPETEDPPVTPPSPPPSVSYTVTEEEWKVNFNLTRAQDQAQAAACEIPCAATPLTQITSYTISAVGENAGVPGTAILKVAPNGMMIEFFVNGVLKEDESGTHANTEVLYQTLTTNLMDVYFPFADYYDDFTFDETKKAYVCENLTSEMLDDYDPTITHEVWTKTAEVTFFDGYLNTVSVSLCDETFTDVFASFVFTFSDINNTTVTL